MQKIFQLTKSGMQIGATLDFAQICFITVEDLDNILVKVACKSLQITVGELIVNYKQVTGCKGMLKGDACFQICQGYLISLTAINSMKLSSLGLQLGKTCFKVVDKIKIDYQQSIRQTENKLDQLERPHQISLNIIFNQNSFFMPINIDDSVLKLKQMLQQRPQFQNITLDMIRLQTKNIVLLNNYKISHYKNIIDGTKVMVLIGYWTKNIISLPHGRCKQIMQLKKGDKILTYNVHSNQIQEDEVKCINQSVSLERVVIILEDNTAIQATVDHMFLCKDNRFKKLRPQYKRQALKQGQILKRFDNSEVVIKYIETQIACGQRKNYHIFGKKNNNLIINDLIVCNAHYLMIYEQKSQQKMIVSKVDSILKIKQQLQDRFKLNNSLCLQFLSHGSSQLNNKCSLLDYNIPHQSILRVRAKKSIDFSYFHPKTLVQMKNTYKMIKDIVPGDVIATFDTKNAGISYIKVTEPIIKRQIFEYYKLTLQADQQISVSSQTYLNLSDGTLKNVEDLFYLQQKSQQRLSLFKVSRGGVKIKTIQKISKGIQGITFCKLYSQNSSFILQCQTVVHNEAVTVMIDIDNRREKIVFAINPATTVEDVKLKIQKMYHINKGVIYLYYRSKQLENERTFQEEGIELASLVMATTKRQYQKQDMKEESIGLMKFCLPEGEIVFLSYQLFRDKTIQQILLYLIPNYNSNYFCMFSSVTILPNEKLNKIESSSQFNKKKIEVKVIKNEKFSFISYLDLQANSIRNASYINIPEINEISLIKIISENDFENSQSYLMGAAKIKANLKLPPFYKQQLFYKPFLYFNSPHIRQQITSFVNNFSINAKNLAETNIYQVIKSLYVNIIYLPNFLNQMKPTFFGIRNFKFASILQKNNAFYIGDFLQTTNNKKSITDELLYQSGTLFCLISTGGKNIGPFLNKPQKFAVLKNGKQVYIQAVELLFQPFSYFIVDKIIRNADYDEVWISEIPSPATLQKDIIIWVDDKPIHNEKGLQNILKAKDIQILSLISTLSAEKWFQEFKWILNSKSINLRLISDMGRYQYEENEAEQKLNEEAGFELIDIIYRKHKLEVKTYIFTGDQKKTLELLENTELQSVQNQYNKHFKITSSGPKLRSFCCKDQW